MKAAALAVLILSSAARAASVVYEHPALKVRLTAHASDGAAAPDALSYEGPKGFYLIRSDELRSFQHVDGWSGFVLDAREFTVDGYRRRASSVEDAVTCRFSDDACVAEIENLIAELRSGGKREAPDEFALRVAALHDQSETEQATWRSYEAESSSAEGAISDKPALDAAKKPLDAAAAAVSAARAERISGEYRASIAAPTAADPNPRADFYWRQSVALDAAAQTLADVGRTLSSEPIPTY